MLPYSSKAPAVTNGDILYAPSAGMILKTDLTSVTHFFLP